MKKILMLLYNWPPYGEVGVLRSLKFAKYLLRSGKWEITVLAVKNAANRFCYGQEGEIPQVKIIRTRHTDTISEIKRWLKFSIPDRQIGWCKYALCESMKLLKNGDYGLIYSSSPPETTHIIAHRLKNKFGIPWVTDLRDLWSQDHYRENNLFKKIVLSLIEKQTFSNADAIITVSEPLRDTLRALHKDKQDNIYCITNGFDPEDFDDMPIEKEEKLVLSYMGKLHPIHQDPTIFFLSLFELLKENKIDRGLIKVRFYIYGFKIPDINGLCKRYQLEGVVEMLPIVEYKKSLQLMQKSSVLLLFPWRGHGSQGWYSQKVFDYLGARRPILAIQPEGGVVEKLINATNSGCIAHGKDEIKKVLGDLYREFKTSGEVKYKGIEEEIRKYTRANTTNQLAEILEKVTSRE